MDRIPGPPPAPNYAALVTEPDDGFEHFVPGELVQAYDMHSRTWRNAVVDKDAPYPRAKTGGAYVSWTPAPILSWESAGGWVSTNCIRRGVI